MAERGVTYWIRYALDRGGLARSKQDARSAGTAVGQEFQRGTDAPFKRIAGAIAGLFAVRQLFQWTKQIVGMGVAGAETASKFAATFGDASDSMDEFLGRVGRAAGLSRNMGRDIAADMGAMAQGMGFARAESAAMAQQMLSAAADLTSFSNVPIERTTRAISSALVGEREALKSLGIVVQEQAVQNRAMADTGKKNADALTQQEKAAATLALITEQMGVRQGDLERTQNSAANTARRLGGEMRTMVETLGAVLVAGDPATDMMAELSDAVARATDWISKNGKAIGAWARVAVTSFRAVFESGRFLVRSLFNVGQILGSGFEMVANSLRWHLNGAINETIELINKLIPGDALDIPIRINDKSPEEFRAEQERLQAAIRRDTDDLADSVWDLGDAYLAVGRAAKDATLAAGGVSMAAPNINLPEAVRRDPRIAAMLGTEIGQNANLARRMGEDPRSLVAGKLRGTGEAAGARTEGEARGMESSVFATLDREVARMEVWRQEMELTKQAAQEMGEGIALSFETFFMSLAEGEGALQSAGQLVRSVAAQTLAALVKGKVEYHMAEGVGKLATGIWPPNPAAIASALKHFAAAALFRAIPGIVGGKGGGGGSFGAGGSVGAGQSVPSNKPQGPDIIIKVDGFDPGNPKHQAELGRAGRDYQERWGGTIRQESGRG